MKLWAVVIGKKGKHKQYVCYVHYPDNLAVFDTRKKAKEYIKYQCHLNYAYVMPFEPTKP